MYYAECMVFETPDGCEVRVPLQRMSPPENYEFLRFDTVELEDASTVTCESTCVLLWRELAYATPVRPSRDADPPKLYFLGWEEHQEWWECDYFECDACSNSYQRNSVGSVAMDGYEMCDRCYAEAVVSGEWLELFKYSDARAQHIPDAEELLEFCPEKMSGFEPVLRVVEEKGRCYSVDMVLRELAEKLPAAHAVVEERLASREAGHTGLARGDVMLAHTHNEVWIFMFTR